MLLRARLGGALRKGEAGAGALELHFLAPLTLPVHLRKRLQLSRTRRQKRSTKKSVQLPQEPLPEPSQTGSEKERLEQVYMLCTPSVGFVRGTKKSMQS